MVTVRYFSREDFAIQTHLQGKPLEFFMTPGIEALGISQIDRDLLLTTSIALYEKSYMVVFNPKDDGVICEDGDHEKLFELPVKLPEVLWAIVDDYGEHFVCTLLLPNEY